MPTNPTRKSAVGNEAASIFEWNLTTASPEGTPIPSEAMSMNDRSVQVIGDLGGGSVTWEGTSDDGMQNWNTLSTPGGLASTFSMPGIKQILESTLYSRPVLVGSVGANVRVICVARKPTR